MSGLRRDWLAGTTLEKPLAQQQSSKRQLPDAQASFAGGAATDDLYEKIAALAEHLEREVDARKAVEAELAKQKALQAELTSSFAALQMQTEARVAVERDGRLGLGEPNHRAICTQQAYSDVTRCVALGCLPSQNTN